MWWAAVHGVVGPVVHVHHGEVGVIADDELYVLGIRPAALLVEDDHSTGERLQPDLDVAETDLTGAGSVDLDEDRFGELGLPATVMTVASVKDENACAATLSNGAPPSARR